MARIEAAMDGMGRNRSAAAKRRYDKCMALKEQWDSEGFWTRENTLAYEIIFKNSDDLDSVSAF